MNKINVSDWKNFYISEIFFTEKNGKNIQVPTGAMISKKILEDGETPRVTVSNFRNGITGYYSDMNDKNYRVYENFISVSFLGTVFYQPNKASLDMKVHCLKPIKHNLNLYTATFLVNIIKKAISNFAYQDQLSSTVLPNLIIKLPIKYKEPDWEYMESYMKNIMQDSEKNIENLQNIKDYKNKVDINKWQEYRLGDLFYKCILNKKSNFKKISDVSLEKTDEFDLPLVSAKHYNNGIMYYGRSSDFDSEIMTLDIVQNGAAAVGDVYAQPQRTGVLEDAYLIKAYDNITSADVLQFLATVIQKDIKQHFSYDDKCTWDKAKEMLIHLPANPNGKPDWEYMENYMKNIMEDTQSKLDKLICC